MGWKARGDRVYYYRMRREGERVVSEYIGAGLLGHLTAADVRDSRAERMCERLRLAQKSREYEELEVEIEDLSEFIESCVAANLLAGGYHRHRRQWRKKRERRGVQSRTRQDE